MSVLERGPDDRFRLKHHKLREKIKAACEFLTRHYRYYIMLIWITPFLIPTPTLLSPKFFMMYSTMQYCNNFYFFVIDYELKILCKLSLKII